METEREPDHHMYFETNAKPPSGPDGVGDMFLGDNAHNVVAMRNATSLDDDRHERALRHIRSSDAINHTRLLGNRRSIRRDQ